MMKTLAQYFMLISFLQMGCSHSKTQFEHSLERKDCEQALKEIPELHPIKTAAHSTQWAAQNLAAYSYVGLNYTAEVAWDVSAGTLIFLGLCGPTLALMSLSSNHGQGTIGGLPCLPAPMKASQVMSPPLGRKAFNATKDFRCPEMSGLVASYEKVISCYEAQPSKENLEKALANIENFQSSKDLYRCTSFENHNRMEERKKKILEALGKL